MRRYLEAFCRHPWLYILPLVLALGGSALLANRAMRNAIPYTAEATVAVNLDPSRARPLGEQPPSQLYTELLGELMETDNFVSDSLKQTSLPADLAALGAEYRVAETVRARWHQAAVGPNTMWVSYRCPEPQACT